MARSKSPMYTICPLIVSYVSVGCCNGTVSFDHYMNNINRFRVQPTCSLCAHVRSYELAIPYGKKFNV